MNRASIQDTIGALLILTILSTVVDSQTKRPQQTLAQPCPDEKVYVGHYRNWVYGFSIVIPARLKGYWNSARCAPDEKYGCVCMGDHGRFIPLESGASIEAYVGYEIEDEWSVRDYEKQDLSYLHQKQGIEQVNVLSSKLFRLGTLKGRRFVVQFDENNKNLLVDHIIALHQGVEYQLTLTTSPDRYKIHKTVFEKVIASWKLTKRAR